MFRRLAFLLALLPVADCLIVGATSRNAIMQPVRPRLAAHPFMGKEEDKEYEEWVRKKRIAAGINPDQTAEDVGAGRRAEGTIYAVGGAITVLVPLIAGIWAYNEGYLTPQ